MITSSVAELGRKWYLISERLPGRTDHAIRNRWHRLLTMRRDSCRMHTGAPAPGALAGTVPTPPINTGIAMGDAAMGEANLNATLATINALTADPSGELDLSALIEHDGSS